jgi:acyl carrier protein
MPSATPAARPEPGPERPAVYESKLTAAAPWTDHRVLGTTVFPASGYVDLAVRAHYAVSGRQLGPVAVSDLQFARALMLAPGKTVGVGIAMDGADGTADGGRPFAIRGDGDRPAEYCRGMIAAVTNLSDGTGPDPEALRAAMPGQLAPGRFYGDLRKVGLEYGASFSTVRELWTGADGQGEALGRVAAAPDGAPAEDHGFRLATMLDGCFQVTGAAIRTLTSTVFEGAYIPVSIRRLVLSGPFPAQVWCHVRLQTNETGSAAVATLRVTDDAGHLIADIADLELRHTTSLSADGSSAALSARPLRRQVGDSRKDLIERLAPLPRDKRVAVVTDWLGEEVRDTLGQAAAELDLDIDNLDPATALLELGLDSLMITELQRRIQEKLNFRFEVMEAVDYQSIENLAGYILDRALAESLEDTPAPVAG